MKYACAKTFFAILCLFSLVSLCAMNNRGPGSARRQPPQHAGAASAGSYDLYTAVRACCSSDDLSAVLCAFCLEESRCARGGQKEQATELGVLRHLLERERERRHTQNYATVSRQELSSRLCHDYVAARALTAKPVRMLSVQEQERWADAVLAESPAAMALGQQLIVQQVPESARGRSASARDVCGAGASGHERASANRQRKNSTEK